jgi:hypothetical protein
MYMQMKWMAPKVQEGPTKANTKNPDGSTVIVDGFIIQILVVPIGFWHLLWPDLRV